MNGHQRWMEGMVQACCNGEFERMEESIKRVYGSMVVDGWMDG